jgi:hypothetical protein
MTIKEETNKGCSSCIGFENNDCDYLAIDYDDNYSATLETTSIRNSPALVAERENRERDVRGSLCRWINYCPICGRKL